LSEVQCKRWAGRCRRWKLQSDESADAAVMIYRHARWSKESLEHRA